MYELTELFVYRPIFMLELLLGECFFFLYLKPRKGLFWRLPLGILICFAFSFAIPILSFDSIFCSILFLTMFMVTVFVAYFIFDESFKKIFIFAMGGYTIQHIAQECYETLIVFIPQNVSNNGGMYGSNIFTIGGRIWFLQILQYTFYIQIFALIYCIAFIYINFQLKDKESFKLDTSSAILLSILLIPINIIFSSIITYSLKNSDILSKCVLHIFNILCCLIVLLFLFELPKRKKAEADLLVLKKIQSLEQKQYKNAMENMEELNIKCHDLKQFAIHLNSLKGNDHMIEDFNKIVNEYDSAFKTNNNALNAVLTEKKQICLRKNIEFTCIINGECLSFLNEVEIYSLFGNLLDNAIEATEKVDPNKRTISLNINQKGKLILIYIYNTYQDDLRIENNKLITTKKDSINHGFGLKSIENIVKKYNGDLKISTNNNIFELNIILQNIKN